MDKFEDVMLDLAWRVFEQCMEDKREIEQKASIVLASAGVLSGLCANVGLILPVLIASISAIFATLSLTVKRYRRLSINESLNVVKEFNDLEEFKRSIVATLGMCEETNRSNIEKPAKFLKISIWLFLLSIIGLLLSLIYLWLPSQLLHTLA